MLLLSAMTSAGGAASLASFDPLSQPSVPNVHASSSVLLDVTAAPGGLLVAVGERGIILTSADDGRTWRQRDCPVSVTLTSVRFASSSQGWAAGHSGVILHTGDGGTTWTRQLDGVQAAETALRDAEAAPPPNRTAQVEAARLLVSDGPDKPFLGLAFKDEHRGIAIGAYGLVFGTGDGGAHWRSLMPALPNPEGKNLYGIVWTKSDVMIDGEMGGLFSSSDDGKSFSTVRSPYQGSFFGLLDAGGGELLAYGLKGHAFSSNDNGQSWSPIDAGTSTSLSSAARLMDGSLVVASTAGDLACRPHGGNVFTPLHLPDAYPFSSLAQAGDGALVIVGVRGVTRLAGFSCAGGRPS